MKFFSTLVSLIFLFQSCQSSNPDSTEIKNIILLIGDGMGTTQVYAGYTANKGKLSLERSQYVGFLLTSSADEYITDSGAGGTAIASGKKANNYTIGINPEGEKNISILEHAEEHGLATGIISTSAITHATPASFISHQEHRNEEYEIAEQFITSQVDIFIGGGKKFFEDPGKNINVSNKLRKEGYTVVYNLDEINPKDTSNIGCLAADGALPKMSEGRGDYLSDATNIALEKLSQNSEGFFIMIEGSQIDWGGHDNDIDYVISEMIDFDKAVGEAFDFADNNPGTLVIVTADHETGGLAITDGNIESGKVTASFAHTHHTPVMVPVFTYGAGADKFAGIYDNTEIFNKMMNAFSFEN